jgi:hypothetical protein
MEDLMDVYSMIKIMESFSIILIVYFGLLVFINWQKAGKLAKVEKVKQYTFEFCINDKTNYDSYASKIELINKNENIRGFLENDLYQALYSFEKIAIGVKNKILDEGIIKDYYFRYFYMFYKAMKYGILLKYRNIENDPFLFIEFEKLINKWLNDKNNEEYYVN